MLEALGVPVLRCGALMRPVDESERDAIAALADNAERNGVEAGSATTARWRCRASRHRSGRLHAGLATAATAPARGVEQLFAILPRVTALLTRAEQAVAEVAALVARIEETRLEAAAVVSCTDETRARADALIGALEPRSRSSSRRWSGLRRRRTRTRSTRSSS